MTFTLLIPAAGRGDRLGSAEPKALLKLAGRPLILWALDAFAGDERLGEIVIAVPREPAADLSDALAAHPLARKLRQTAGGATRQDSVGLALDAAARSAEFILVHDAARPLVSRDTINLVLAGLRHSAACIPGLPVSDTIKRVERPSSRVLETLSRAELIAAQTPQGVRADVFRAAHRLARESGVQCTDDAALIEHFGLGRVALVPGDPANFKITHPADFERAASLLSGGQASLHSHSGFATES